MTEPTKEQIDKWRSDFEKEFEIDDISLDYFKREGSYDSFSEDDKWQGYLAAKKSDFEEIKTLKEQLAEAVGLLRYVQHPKNTDEWVDCGKEVDRFLEKQDKENGSSNESN